jgi:hypothetical protein
MNQPSHWPFTTINTFSSHLSPNIPQIQNEGPQSTCYIEFSSHELGSYVLRLEAMSVFVPRWFSLLSLRNGKIPNALHHPQLNVVTRMPWPATTMIAQSCVQAPLACFSLVKTLLPSVMHVAPLLAPLSSQPKAAHPVTTMLRYMIPSIILSITPFTEYISDPARTWSSPVLGYNTKFQAR